MKKKMLTAVAAGLTCLSLGLPLAADTLLPHAYAAEDEYAAENERTAKQSERFKLILSDLTYNYYLDMESARWVPCPHTSENIIDVWIKLVPDAEAMVAAGEYTYPQKYFLEHYYIHPKRQQIQFLAELEVTGHPMNDVDTGTYSATAWENLVPESIEDKIFRGVMKNIKKAKKTKGKSSGGGDILFDVFKIGL